MATTQLADIYNPLVFNAAVDEAAIELNAFLASGVMAQSPELDSLASVGGNIGELPFHHNLDKSGEPNYSTDNPAVTSTPKKITTGKMIYMLASMNDSWSTMDLTRELALMDPLSAITSKIGQYWATQIQKRVVAASDGIIADNIAADSGDMVVNIYSDIATPLAGNIISAEAIIDVQQTMGDHMSVLSVIAMHSVTYTNLKKANLIDMIPNARGEVVIPTYLGMRVVIDDGMTVIAGTNSPAYRTLLYAPGAFDNGQGAVATPSELERIAGAGNGGGQDVIHSRRSEIIHPYGFQQLVAGTAGQSTTLAELATAASWDRVVDRKNVGIACLIHNN